jgi:hypothetical protein
LKNVYVVPPDAKAAVAAASCVGDINKPTRMKLYNAVARAMQSPDFPPAIVAKWAAAAEDKTGTVRLQLLQAFVDDPTCATMVMQESKTSSSENWNKTGWVFRTKDDLEKEWQHLDEERLKAKLAQLMGTARREITHPQTGEPMYEVLEAIKAGTASRDRTMHELTAHANVSSGAAAQELRGLMDARPAASSRAALCDKPADPKAAKKMAAAKKKAQREAAKAEAAAAGLPDPTAKPKPFVHPGLKMCESLRKKLAAATQLCTDLEMAAGDLEADLHTKNVIDMLRSIVAKGDAMVLQLTQETRTARGAVTDAWPQLTAAAEQLQQEFDRELKFSRSRLQGLRKPLKKA